MLPFLRRRAGALTEALLLAVIASLLAGVTGFGSMTGAPVAERPDAAIAPSTQTLTGVLDVVPDEAGADPGQRSATLTSNGRPVTVRISREDAKRAALWGAIVTVTGSWAPDGRFVAALVAPADGGEDAGAADAALAAATGSLDRSAAPTATRGAGKRASVEGTLSFAHGDEQAHGRQTAMRYHVTGPKGTTTEVRFAHAPLARLAGRQVKLTGTMKGAVLLADGGTTTTTATTTAVAKTNSTGAHRVAVILLNWQDSVSQPYTTAATYGVAFGNANSVAAYYDETSWGQLTLSGDVYGWYTLPVGRGAGCDYSTWATAANTAAAANGFAYADYDNVVYAFPATSGCSWTGLASMPGKQSWLNGPSGMSLGVMAHELGHNFGAHHANTISCAQNGVRVSLVGDISTCTLTEYGDPYSVMGGSSKYHHTDFARDASYKWLASSAVVTATSGGEYTVTPAEVQGGTPVVRVPRTPSTYLTLEYRQPYGTQFDAFAATSPVVNGVTVRITAGATTQTKLVDCTPGTNMFSDAPCPVGATITDPLTGVSVTTLSVSSSGAVVRITFGGGGPASPTPAPTAAPTPTPTPTATASPTPAPTAALTPTPTATASPTPAPTAAPTPTATPSPDTQTPTAPGNLKASVARNGKVSLSWGRSSDNVKVAGYRVYRDGMVVTSTTTTKWSDGLMLPAGSSRTYHVVAYDAAGNVSTDSNVVTLQ